MSLYINNQELLDNNDYDNISITSTSEGLLIDVNGKSSNSEDVIKINDNIKETLYDVASSYSKSVVIDAVDLHRNDQVTFKSKNKTLSTIYGDGCWFIINHLVDEYSYDRNSFFDMFKDISRIAIVQDKESSYKIYEDIDKNGNKTNWLILRVSLAGPTSICDLQFVKLVFRKLLEDVTEMPSSIKLVSHNIDGINPNELKMVELSNQLLAFDQDISKYFFKAYSERLKQIEKEIDIKYGIKQ